MSLQGKFVVNDASYAPLTFAGLGTFLAFSGNGKYRNHGGCESVPENGPIPTGKYWIVDRPSGGMYSRLRAAVKDEYNRVFNDAAYRHSDWFALYRDDMSIDDGTWVRSVWRGNFRLHPGSLSLGCITLAHNGDYGKIRDALINAMKIPVPCMKNMFAYGFIEVTNNGSSTCP
ncbi:DUF2778 domain-containing protein [Erwinia amylovora]